MQSTKYSAARTALKRYIEARISPKRRTRWKNKFHSWLLHWWRPNYERHISQVSNSKLFSWFGITSGMKESGSQAMLAFCSFICCSSTILYYNNNWCVFCGDTCLFFFPWDWFGICMCTIVHMWQVADTCVPDLGQLSRNKIRRFCCIF